MSLLNNLKTEEIVLKNKPHAASYVFHRLPPGMGIVLGNYLRQFLLKYTSGIAPVGAKISDKDGSAESEFSVLAGVRETTPYLIINLKKIIVEEKKKKEGIFCLELNVENKEKQERVITAADFQKDKDIEIKNPEIYLAALAPATSLEIKLYFQKNWGYHKEEEQEKNYFAGEEGVIVFDTDYSPVKGGMVNFQTTLDVNSQEIPEEKLTITITTNGAVKPKKVLQEVLEMSKSSFSAITDSISSEKKIAETK